MRKTMLLYRVLLTAVLSCTVSGSPRAELTRDYMTIVGSTTVFPFSAKVIEHFVKRLDFKTPQVQTTGSGGGFMLFCMGTGVLEPDITYASRRITTLEGCQRVPAWKKVHIGLIPGIRELLAEFTSDKAWGSEGYLSDVGLVPMPEAELRKVEAGKSNLRHEIIKGHRNASADSALALGEALKTSPGFWLNLQIDLDL